MTLVIIDDRGRCTVIGARPGPYDAEFARDGTISLVPLVRATDNKPPKPPAPSRTVAPPRSRRSLKRNWAKVKPGTVLTGPPGLGEVVMGKGGLLADGRTPNQAFTDAGITNNAWMNLRLPDGRVLGSAYDSGDFD